MQGVTEIITAVVVTFLVTCVGTLVTCALVALLVMRKCLNKLHLKQTQQQEHDGAYEVVEGGKPAEAEYEMVDVEPEGINMDINPAYASTAVSPRRK